MILIYTIYVNPNTIYILRKILAHLILGDRGNPRYTKMKNAYFARAFDA
jgi:hypothetical protein